MHRGAEGCRSKESLEKYRYYINDKTINSLNYIHRCDAYNDGQFYYIKSTQTFKHCSFNTLTNIDFTGENGFTGHDRIMSTIAAYGISIV